MTDALPLTDVNALTWRAEQKRNRGSARHPINAAYYSMCVCVCVCVHLPLQSQMLSVFLSYWLCLIYVVERTITFRLSSLWPHNVFMRTLYFRPVVSSSSFYLFRRLFSAVADSMLPYFHTWCRLSANLECRSEMCCTRLTENTGRKKSPKIRHLATIAQLCRAVSSQLRHISTIGKNLLNSNISSTCPTIWRTSAH